MGKNAPVTGRLAEFREDYRKYQSVRWSVYIILSLFIVEGAWSWFYYFAPVGNDIKQVFNDQVMFTIAITNYQALVVAMVYARIAEPHADKIDRAERWMGATLEILEKEGYTPEEVARGLKDLIQMMRKYGQIPESAKGQARHVFDRLMAFTPEQWDIIVKRLGTLSDEGIDYLENMTQLSDEAWRQFIDTAKRRKRA